MCLSFPARVVEVEPGGRTALAESGSRQVRLRLDLLLVEGVRVAPGDWVLANAGSAVAPIGEDEARELLRPFEEESA